VKDRFELLAGLVDTDGHVSKEAGNSIEYTTVSKQLCADMLFLIRSLGFTASSTIKPTSWVHAGVKKYSTAYRIHFSGDTTRIPLKIERHKKFLQNANQRHNNCTAFSVVDLPEDDYYGFELDGDHLYMTEDFTVQHNSGKSRIIAEFIRRILTKKNHVRFMMLTHVKELIEQNAARLTELWPSCPLGIYSASIGYKQYSHPIIFGGIQSCYKHPELFGHIHILIIDEAHLVSDKSESMYGAMIAGLKKRNPDLVVIGFTATAYRLGMGKLIEGPIFDDVFFDNTTMDDFVKLIDDGYLCDLVPVNTKTQFDLSNVKISGGDFQEKSLDENINRDEVTRAIVVETMIKAQGRNKGLAFCITKAHAENMAARFTEMGWLASFIHSDLSKEERAQRLADYAAGKYKVLCNVGVLTTGFDSPETDFMVIARPSQSTSLHVQIMGRGMRPHPSKPNTLVLDFAGNTMRLGPVNDPVMPVKKGETAGEPPIRVCSMCDTINHAASKVCKHCGFEFPPPKIKITMLADSSEIIRRADIPKIINQPVKSVLLNTHKAQSGADMIKMTIYDGNYFNDIYLSFDPVQKFLYAETQRSWVNCAFQQHPLCSKTTRMPLTFYALI
jgi:DNA repair protein RadD